MATTPAASIRNAAPRLFSDYRRVRELSEQLAAALAPEDQVVQTIADVSPTKWHLAHVTWFFERFVLGPNLPGYSVFDERWQYPCNSYQEAGTPARKHPLIRCEEEGLRSR